MWKLLRSKKAQNTAEYALLIALVIGVFSAMQIYVRRGLNARIKDGTDNLPRMVLGQTNGEASMDLFNGTEQYEPYYIREGAYTMTTTSSEGKEIGLASQAGGIRDLSGATEHRMGSQTITGAKED